MKSLIEVTTAAVSDPSEGRPLPAGIVMDAEIESRIRKMHEADWQKPTQVTERQGPTRPPYSYD